MDIPNDIQDVWDHYSNIYDIEIKAHRVARERLRGSQNRYRCSDCGYEMTANDCETCGTKEFGKIL